MANEPGSGEMPKRASGETYIVHTFKSKPLGLKLFSAEVATETGAVVILVADSQLGLDIGDEIVQINEQKDVRQMKTSDIYRMLKESQCPLEMKFLKGDPALRGLTRKVSPRKLSKAKEGSTRNTKTPHKASASKKMSPEAQQHANMALATELMKMDANVY
jgi:hypothetical protein